MSHWSKRASIQNDVVFFEYIPTAEVQKHKLLFVWDLDKTYLDTHFESLSGLYRTIIEKAFQKKNVPGTRSLVRTLTIRGESNFPLYFVTASPPQMEERIFEKLQLDGIKPHGMFFKDNLKNLKPGRLRRLNQQVGFKLQALLLLRSQFDAPIEQILWGDDSESDAVIYSLYSDICARRLPEKSLRKILAHYHVRGEQVSVILNLSKKIVQHDPVKRVYINLASDTDPDYYAKFGYRILPTYNSFQVALDLFQDNQIGEEQLQMVALDLLKNYGFSRDELALTYDDLITRQVLHNETVEKLNEILSSEDLLPNNFSPKDPPINKLDLEAMKANSDQTERWVPSFIDYLHDFR